MIVLEHLQRDVIEVDYLPVEIHSAVVHHSWIGPARNVTFRRASGLEDAIEIVEITPAKGFIMRPIDKCWRDYRQVYDSNNGYVTYIVQVDLLGNCHAAVSASPEPTCRVEINL